MTPTRKRRLIGVLVIIIGVGVAAVVAMKALNENMLYFWSPSDLQEQSVSPGQRIRLGGLVADGSVQRASDSLAVAFTITDGAATVDVRFNDILPDLFREGQGVIAIGEMAPEGHFNADEVLAKHDENYMPPEVADALKETGHWEEEPGK